MALLTAAAVPDAPSRFDESPRPTSEAKSDAPRKFRTLREAMTPAPYSVQRDHLLVIAARLMDDKRIRHLPVFENRKLCGVLSRRACDEAIATPDGKSATVASAVLSVPLVAAPEESLREVAQKMLSARADVAFVVDKERLVGVFTSIDAIGFLIKLLDEESTSP